VRFSFAGSRQQPIDRAPLTNQEVYNAATVAPHGPTVRWTYTVPTGRKALLQSAYVKLMRQVAAAPVGYAQAYIVYQTTGIIISASINTNVIGDGSQLAIGQSITMLAGEEIHAGSDDASTGGSFRYLISANLLEYDA